MLLREENFNMYFGRDFGKLRARDQITDFCRRLNKCF